MPWLEVIIIFIFFGSLLGLLAIDGLIVLHQPRKILDTATELRSRNANMETHQVITPDGYILKIFRLFDALPAPGHVALFQHGLLSDSTDWVGFDDALSYDLRDLGWDVWFGNHRGNIYCRAHEELSINSRKFWEFSFHELGTIDLPSIINYILEVTNRRKLVYIGHSQGCSEFFAMTSLMPEMNNKIEVMFAMAPVAGLRNAATRYPILYKMALYDRMHPVKSMTQAMGFYRFGFFWDPPQVLVPFLTLILNSILYPLFNFTLAEHVMDANSNYPHPDVIDNSLEYFILCRLRNGCSLRQLKHFSQSLTGDRYFHFLDRGRKENLRVYGRPCPPAYDISKITCHVSLMWGKHDTLTCPRDVITLYRRLRNRTLFCVDGYKHGDFVCSTVRNDVILKHILNTLGTLSRAQVE